MSSGDADSWLHDDAEALESGKWRQKTTVVTNGSGQPVIDEQSGLPKTATRQFSIGEAITLIEDNRHDGSPRSARPSGVTEARRRNLMRPTNTL